MISQGENIVNLSIYIRPALRFAVMITAHFLEVSWEEMIYIARKGITILLRKLHM